jgi:hypothetical protein
MGPELTLTFVVVFGLAGIGWTVIALIDWLRYRRLPRAIGGLAVASTAVVMISLMTAEPRHGVIRRMPESVRRPEPPPQYGVLRRVSKPRSSRRKPEYRTRRYNTGRHRAAEQARVDELHRWIGPALEQYRQGRGVYPPTLEAAGIGTPMTRFGPLYYYSSGSKSEPWYLLSFGDIEMHRFSADWDSRTKRWTVTSLSF